MVRVPFRHSITIFYLSTSARHERTSIGEAQRLTAFLHLGAETRALASLFVLLTATLRRR